MGCPVSKSLAEALPEEMARVRGIKAVYDGLPDNAGKPAAFMMEASLRAADQAIMGGDVIAMLQCYEDLKGYEL